LLGGVLFLYICYYRDGLDIDLYEIILILLVAIGGPLTAIAFIIHILVEYMPTNGGKLLNKTIFRGRRKK
jgi:hypothetical protein